MSGVLPVVTVVQTIGEKASCVDFRMPPMPSASSRSVFGISPASISGRITSHVPPSSPIIITFGAVGSASGGAARPPFASAKRIGAIGAIGEV